MLATQQVSLRTDAANMNAPPAAPPRPRALGGFLDDSDDEDDAVAQGVLQDAGTRPDGSPPPAKKRMLEQSPADEDPATFLNPTVDEVDLSLDRQPMEAEDDIPEDLDDLYAIHESFPPAQQIQSQLLDEQNRYDLLFGSARESILLESESREFQIQTCSGRTIPVRQRTARKALSYETMVAARSRTKEGRAKRSYYGIDIHELIDGAKKDIADQKAEKKKAEETQQQEEKERREREERLAEGKGKQMEADGDATAMEIDQQPEHAAPAKRLRKPKRNPANMLWTEKYRARNFLDLVGDDLTNRLVLRWLKRWDPIVFPHAAKKRPTASARRPGGAAPGGAGSNAMSNNNSSSSHASQAEDEKPLRKILILAGPPGLGKTTLAHVCARQAGYEVLEINASDDRSRDVVNGRIRTSLGTENVKTLDNRQTGAAKPTVARPVCVVVDEVDGVVSGSGASGEGGFVKALIDLVLADQRNAGGHGAASANKGGRERKGKKDDFRQMRPLVLICNDVYHVSLRPLRQSGLAEIVHVGKPSVDTVVSRLKTIFEKEGIPCEKEAARKICEAAWGMATGAEARRGAESTAEGDLRGVMVVGEWVARRLRATTEAEARAKAKTADAARPAAAAAAAASTSSPKLTRLWVDQHVMPDLAHGGSAGGGGARGIGRGGTREIVTRVFQEGAGFPKTAAFVVSAGPQKRYRHEQPKEQMSFAEHQRRYANERLRAMIDTSGDVDRIVGDIFAAYPLREFNDDSYLSKPDAAYEWLHFHDACARRVYAHQDWELLAYSSQPVLACHQLFASSKRYQGDEDGAGGAADTPPGPFSGPRADFAAREAEKHNRAALQAIQADLPLSLLRAFRNADDLAADFLPYVVRLVSPDVKPVLVNLGSSAGNSGGNTTVASVRRESEKVLVKRAAEVLAELGIRLQRGVLEDTTGGVLAGRPQWVYRMDPDIDSLASFETASSLILPSHAPTRYAVRQVLDQELRKTLAHRASAARQARFQAGRPLGEGGVDKDKAAGTNHETGHETSDKQQQSTMAVDEIGVKRDFFGRIITPAARPQPLQEGDGNAGRGHARSKSGNGGPWTEEEEGGTEKTRVWVSFHEGLNNAVRKPISLDEFLRGL